MPSDSDSDSSSSDISSSRSSRSNSSISSRSDLDNDESSPYTPYTDPTHDLGPQNWHSPSLIPPSRVYPYDPNFPDPYNSAPLSPNPLGQEEKSKSDSKILIIIAALVTLVVIGCLILSLYYFSSSSAPVAHNGFIHNSEGYGEERENINEVVASGTNMEMKDGDKTQEGIQVGVREDKYAYEDEDEEDTSEFEENKLDNDMQLDLESEETGGQLYLPARRSFFKFLIGFTLIRLLFSILYFIFNSMQMFMGAFGNVVSTIILSFVMMTFMSCKNWNAEEWGPFLFMRNFIRSFFEEVDGMWEIFWNASDSLNEDFVLVSSSTITGLMCNVSFYKYRIPCGFLITPTGSYHGYVNVMMSVFWFLCWMIPTIVYFSRELLHLHVRPIFYVLLSAVVNGLLSWGLRSFPSF